MDADGNFAEKIKDLEKRIQAENATVCSDKVPSLSNGEPKLPLNFNLMSPSVTRKKPKPLLMTHATVGPAMGRAISPDMDGETVEPSLLGFRDSFRLTRQRRLESAGGLLPPGVYTNAAISSAKPEDHQMEYEEKLKEIIDKTNIITINGKKYPDCKIEDLENLGELGHGTCGTVSKMRFKKTGDVLAVKIMRKSGNREENKRIIRDLDVVLKSHDCPHIVQCVGCFITDSEVWICMEMMATCLDKLLKRTNTPVPEKILGKMAVSVVKALHYLKEKHGVIHRDVKPSNILLDAKGTFKLCDFGISGRLVDSKAKTRCGGCAAYMAPERICPVDPNRPDYDIRADVWSFGISLVELATGELPYTGCKTDFEVLTKILDDIPPSLPTHKGFSMDFCAFVKDCLIKDCKRRPKYRKLLDHAFILRYEVVHVDVAAWVKQVYSPIKYPAFHADLFVPASLPPPARSPQSAPQTPQKSWFVKPTSKSIFRSSNVPSTAPLPRKQYNVVQF